MQSKLSFARHITANFMNLVRLVWHSRKLRWSKSGFIKRDTNASPVRIKIKWLSGEKNLYLRTFDGDIDIFYEIFWKQVYHIPQIRTSTIRNIVDLGANVGLSALYFLRQYPGARIVCVEPDSRNFEILKMNLADEVITGIATVTEAAVMDHVGSVQFASAEMKYNSRIAQTHSKASDKVRAINMDAIFKKNFLDKIDLLKIDVEGSEKYIFSGDTSWLDFVDNVLIECHSPKDYETCMKAFQRHRFSVKSIHADPANQNLFWAKRTGYIPPTIN